MPPNRAINSAFIAAAHVGEARDDHGPHLLRLRVDEHDLSALHAGLQRHVYSCRECLISSDSERHSESSTIRSARRCSLCVIFR